MPKNDKVFDPGVFGGVLGVRIENISQLSLDLRLAFSKSRVGRKTIDLGVGDANLQATPHMSELVQLIAEPVDPVFVLDRNQNR
jgi:hypothetical protein